ncbi:MAG: acetylornithine deacetylase [Candidatus Puniceispirillales bacterium WSBS_2018_MAG_OTU23]
MTTPEILTMLIAHPTVSKDSNRRLIDDVAALLKDHGVTAVIIENDDGTKANLFATTGTDTSISGGIMLSGHTDVVPVKGQDWTKPPFEAVHEQGRVYGRGTADMKGFVASSINAFCAATKRPLKTPLHLALSYDEEIGCIGARSLVAMLKAAPYRPDMCIVGEPTNMAIATGHKGKTALHADCIGVAAHSALAPTAVNAIHLACDLIGAIRALQDDLIAVGVRDAAYDIPYTTLHAGVINAGIALNIVPNHAAVKFEIRNLAEDDPKVILNRLKAAIAPIITAAQQKAPAADIQINITNEYPGLETPIDAAVVDFVKSLTGGNTCIKVAFGTEGGLFSHDLGIPTVVCGPGSMEQGHKADEYISLDQLAACDDMLARLLLRLEDGI